MTEVEDIAPTGIEGLDDVLRGGLPRNRTYLVKGSPGVGKTTLSLQFLLAGAARGERGLYITLSETADELRVVARSHGWSLDELSIFELKPFELSRDAEAPYSMFHPAEVELGEVMQVLLAEVDRVQPTRIVFDSLSEIRLLAQEPLRYRRQILALKQHLVGRRCTVLLLDDYSAEHDAHLESLAHGVISLERHVPVIGAARRRLQIAKLRGVNFRDGYHDFRVITGGLTVYQRLVASEHQLNFEPALVKSGIAELDILLGGGLTRGSATLLIGPAGTGKSALASQFSCEFAKAGGKVAIYTFDESEATLLARADSLGMGLREHCAAGLVHTRQVDPAELSPGEFAYNLRLAVERDGVRMLVIDSLSGYLNAMPGEQFLLMQLHELLSFTGQHGVTTLLISTQHGLIGPSMTNPVDISYLADAVVLLRYFEAFGRVRNALSVLKKRTGPHERTIREFSMGSHGITIGPPLSGFQGVLTGVPTFAGEELGLMGGRDGANS